MNYKDILHQIYENSEVVNGESVVKENYFHKLAEDLNTLFPLRNGGTNLKIRSLEENAQTLTKKIHKLEDSYINADECDNESDKKHIGKELKRLRKLRENL